MADLSPRQREILDLVAAGRTSKEIASELGISESTVNWHISNAFGRLGASSRAEAVALAMREEVQRPDANVEFPDRPNRRPPLPLSAVAFVVAVTLVLGLFGGALLAGWQFTPPISPSASAAPSTSAPPPADPTARPTGVLAPRRRSCRRCLSGRRRRQSCRPCPQFRRSCLRRRRRLSFRRSPSRRRPIAARRSAAQARHVLRRPEPKSR